MACSGTSQQNTTVHSGDSARIPVNFVDCAGVAVDVTGATLTYTVHLTALTDALFTRTTPTEIVIADNGESAAIYLVPEDTALDSGYFHKLVITDGAGNVLTTLTGTVRFSKEEITCCDALTARIDTDLFVPGAAVYMLDFSSAQNSAYISLF